MAVVEVHAGGVRLRREPASLRWRVALTIAFVVAAAFLYEEAVEDRHAIAHRAMAGAVAGSSAFDREIAATRFMLQGLSRSPALKSRDLRAFYDQMAETPRPEGSWFVLWGMNGQVLNTIRPFGTRLPTRAEIGGTGDGYARVRDRGLSISNRTMAPVVKVPTIAVHLRLDGADGEMWGMAVDGLAGDAAERGRAGTSAAGQLDHDRAGPQPRAHRNQRSHIIRGVSRIDRESPGSPRERTLHGGQRRGERPCWHPALRCNGLHDHHDCTVRRCERSRYGRRAED
jgi:hypothetical protein